jgi:diadenosine tetraphosphate (Ap4A) HIT family hydrolase
LENEKAFAVLDGFPVSAGHTLICPKRGIAELFDASQSEIDSIWQLANIRKKQLVDEDRLITGFNLGVNSGAAAGQTVPHLHFHLIPRRTGDTPNPIGGVRGVIPGKMNYTHSQS